ncbi:uncharacterized protein BXZ73DRAFT_97314 [Epithele typhae]|uniref:uncharacterized protein n=1 Tax=Epithele typhae TaxID=378194 RepID=UPI0020084ECB|nr:uncharacterized protein BXZ73DRAFT_97314 [Epithele typhae]KAH9943264.1 hypothetical protein BXZ73DRAFT_97314 [Epithele typhae]
MSHPHSCAVRLACAVPVTAETAQASVPASPTSTSASPTSASASHTSTARLSPASPSDGQPGTSRLGTSTSSTKATSHFVVPSHSFSHTHSFPAQWSILPTPSAGAPEQSRPHPHVSGAGARPPGGRHQSRVTVALEIIAGLTGLVLASALFRCVYSYRRAPARDRIAALVDRHTLQREVEESERGRIVRSLHATWRPPPPRYEPAPEYDAVAPAGDSIDWGAPPGFTDPGHYRDGLGSPFDGTNARTSLARPPPSHPSRWA